MLPLDDGAGANIDLELRDVVALYTGGITVSENAQRQLYRTEQLCAIVRGNRTRSTSDIRQAVINHGQHHVAGQPICDDITVLIFKQR